LRGLSPQNTLDRGYAILRNAGGHVITQVSEAVAGSSLRVTVSDGDIAATVADPPAKGN
jgi:exodeoxyribonuclease VII large subunit